MALTITFELVDDDHWVARVPALQLEAGGASMEEAFHAVSAALEDVEDEALSKRADADPRRGDVIPWDEAKTLFK